MNPFAYTRSTSTQAKRAAEAALQGARAYEHNRYKIEMSKRVVARALRTAAEGGRQG